MNEKHHFPFVLNWEWKRNIVEKVSNKLDGGKHRREDFPKWGQR